MGDVLAADSWALRVFGHVSVGVYVCQPVCACAGLRVHVPARVCMCRLVCVRSGLSMTFGAATCLSI